MAKTLNFNTIKREYFTVTLPDEDKTTIMISTPTKELLGKIVSLSSNLQIDYKDENAVDILFNELYGAIAQIMSINKGGIVITKEKPATGDNYTVKYYIDGEKVYDNNIMLSWENTIYAPTKDSSGNYFDVGAHDISFEFTSSDNYVLFKQQVT